MAQQAAILDGVNGARLRVRTPGKYIVLCLFVPVAVIALGAGIWLNTVSNRSIAALEYRMSASGAKAAYFKLPAFLVDLAPDQNGRTAFLKIRASISLGDEDANTTAEHIEALQPAVNERLTFFLRELRPEDFESSDGMERVKAEMLRRINLVIAPVRANDVVIEELVIQ